MKKKILITGVAGMIGSKVLELKLKNKERVYGVDNFLNKNSVYLKEFFSNKNFFLKKKDASLNKKMFNKIIFDEVWMLAANSDIKKGITNPEVDFKNTYLTTYNFLNNIKDNIKANHTKLIFTSSSAIFGNVKKKININFGPYQPISNYGAMKAASESYISYFAFNFNIPFYIFRLPNVISENYTHGIINDFVKKILSKKNYFHVLGNGLQRKPYVHANDLVKIIDRVITNKKYKNTFHNLSPNDNGATVKFIAEETKKIFKSKKKLVYQKNKFGWKGDVPIYSYKNTLKKNSNLNFKLSSKETITNVLKKIYDAKKY